MKYMIKKQKEGIKNLIFCNRIFIDTSFEEI